jgi:polyisoprenoid-binding protein YceI
MKLTPLLTLPLVMLFTTTSMAQKYTAETTFVSFYSHATIEDITAENKKTSSIFNSANGEIVFSVPIKEFEFAKSLMKEHFNEKYMESEKFPKSTFQGKVTGFDIKANGPQQVKAVGKLTIHGMAKEIEIPGTLEVKDGKIMMKAKFPAKLEDYNITRPQLLWQNIAEEVEVTVDFTFKAM